MIVKAFGKPYHELSLFTEAQYFFFNSQISDLYLFKDIAFINYKQCTICCGFLKLFIADSPQVRMTQLLSRE